MAGFLSPATRERIRAASDIVDVIGGYLPLKKNGANFTALCPFHKEKSPSFNVNPHKQIFHCFGCHKGGDVFTFVKDYENIGFMDAIRRLAERAKIPLEFENSPGEQQSRHLKDQLLEIHDKIAQRWQNVLANEAAGQLARDYLAKRGVSADAIKLFRIGAAPELWDDTVNWAKSKNYDLAVVEQAGLIIRKEITPAPDAAPAKASDEPDSALRTPHSAFRFYDRFRGRLMFPICDEQGRVVGFSGRILSGDEKTAKYVNSPETPIFTKSKIFFGLDKSKRAILDAGSAIICEGQLDLIACFMNGVQNVIAPQGTAFTDQHARILKRYANEAVLCFDSDLAGQKASVRGLDGLLASNFATASIIGFEPAQRFFDKQRNPTSHSILTYQAPTRNVLLSSDVHIKVAILPSPHDPDSFIKKFGAEAFRELIKNARPFFDFYLDYLCKTNDISSDRGKTFVVKSMAELILKTNNMILLDAYAKKTAERLGVFPESVRAEFKKNPIQRAATAVNNEEVSQENTAAIETPRPSSDEFHLLKLLLLNEELVGFTALHLDLNWIQNSLARQIIAQRFAAQTNEAWQSIGAFLDECDSSEARNLITEAVAEERKIPNPEIQVPHVILKLRNQFFDRQIAALTQKLSQPQTDDAEKLGLLREQQKLKEQKRTPLAPL